MKGIICSMIVVAAASVYTVSAYGSPVRTQVVTPVAARISTPVVPVATRVATPTVTQFIPVAARIATPVATQYVPVATRIAAEPIATAPVFASFQPVAVRQQQVLVDAQPLQFGGGVSVPLSGSLGLGFGIGGGGLDGADFGGARFSVADFGGASFDGSQFGTGLSGFNGGFLAKK